MEFEQSSGGESESSAHVEHFPTFKWLVRSRYGQFLMGFLIYGAYVGIGWHNEYQEKKIQEMQKEFNWKQLSVPSLPILRQNKIDSLQIPYASLLNTLGLEKVLTEYDDNSPVKVLICGDDDHLQAEMSYVDVKTGLRKKFPTVWISADDAQRVIEQYLTEDAVLSADDYRNEEITYGIVISPGRVGRSIIRLREKD